MNATTMKKARPALTAAADGDDDNWSFNTGRTTVRASNVRKGKSVRFEQCVPRTARPAAAFFSGAHRLANLLYLFALIRT